MTFDKPTDLDFLQELAYAIRFPEVDDFGHFRDTLIEILIEQRDIRKEEFHARKRKPV